MIPAESIKRYIHSSISHFVLQLLYLYIIGRLLFDTFLSTQLIIYMDITIILTKILGIYMLVAGLSGLLYPGRMKSAMKEFMKSSILPYFDAALALIFGLFIVLTHNIWEGLNAIIITFIGWFALAEGLLLMLLPQDSIKKMIERFHSPTTMKTFSIIAIILGLYLTYAGFFA